MASEKIKRSLALEAQQVLDSAFSSPSKNTNLEGTKFPKEAGNVKYWRVGGGRSKWPDFSVGD